MSSTYHHMWTKYLETPVGAQPFIFMWMLYMLVEHEFRYEHLSFKCGAFCHLLNQNKNSNIGTKRRSRNLMPLSFILFKNKRYRVVSFVGAS